MKTSKVEAIIIEGAMDNGDLEVLEICSH